VYGYRFSAPCTVFLSALFFGRNRGRTLSQASLFFICGPSLMVKHVTPSANPLPDSGRRKMVNALQAGDTGSIPVGHTRFFKP
jgi:hypothetical protein